MAPRPAASNATNASRAVVGPTRRSGSSASRVERRAVRTARAARPRARPHAHDGRRVDRRVGDERDATVAQHDAVTEVAAAHSGTGVGPASAASSRAHSSRVIQTTARAAAPSARTSASASGIAHEPADRVLLLQRQPVGTAAGDPVERDAGVEQAARARRAVGRDRPPAGTRGRRGWRYRGPTPDRRAARRSRPGRQAPARPPRGLQVAQPAAHRTSGRARASRRSGPGARGVPPAASASASTRRSRRRGAELPHPLHELVDERASHRRRAARRAARSARRGRRRRPPSASFTVRTDCPSDEPGVPERVPERAGGVGIRSARAGHRDAGASRRRRTRGTAPGARTSRAPRRAHAEEPSIPRAAAAQGVVDHGGEGAPERRRPGGRGRRSTARARRAPRRSRTAALQRVGPRLSGADPPHVLHRDHPHLAVTDLAGVRGR